jgi:hypothetical protein
MAAFNHWRIPGLTALFSGLLVAGLPGQEIVGIDGLFGDLYSIDPKTGLATLTGSTGLNQFLWTSLARDSQGKLFSAYGRFDHPIEVYELDPFTGQATFVCQTNLNGIGALAFGPGDVLYALQDTTTPVGGGPDDLYTIDLATGATARIGATGRKFVATLDYANGVMFSYDVTKGLVRIDLATGLATDVNPDFRGPQDQAESLCFGEDGALYLVDAGLWVMDKITGVPCLVGSTFYPGVFGGVEFLPGAALPFVLWTLGMTGGPMGAEFAGATPDGSVALLLALGPGGPTAVASGYPCAGTLLDLNPGLSLVAVLRADAQGRSRIGPTFVPAAAAGSARLQALDLTTCATSNLAQVIY